MKYPQLVSTRAVNAISDWLVSRLEQLGVEAPLIYSRLLLSLLQSSVQINDPIEFSSLETFLANRKGNNKRYPPCDTNTLRKITAVQCLMEIVSSEQEITKIENLVDELCEKLIDFEKQSTSLEEDEDLQIAASALKTNTTTPATHSLISSLNKSNEEEQQLSPNAAIVGDAAHATTESKFSETKTSSSAAVTKNAKQGQQPASDVEDPRKRYYRAFPALSKEMEDSIGLLRRNTKTLTWPVDRKLNSSIKNKTSSNNTNATTAVIDTTSSTSSSSALATTTAVEKANITICVDGGVSGGPSTLIGVSQGGDCNTVLSNTAGVKRKSKRRRNQVMSKGKTTAGNNIRKNSYCGGSSSPTWDTDFEGSWEMGRDLIKEFIVKQNNRNRSTSESAAYNMAIGGCGNNSVISGACETSNEIQDNRITSIMNDKATTDNNLKVAGRAEKQQQQQIKAANNINQNNEELAEVLADPCVVEVSLCENIVENSKSDDMSDMTEGSLSTARRLYERDISNDSINEQNLYPDHPIHHQPYHHHEQEQEQESSSNSLSEQLDFAQFKAKFNSSVEALWKTTSNSSDSASVSNINQSLLQSSIVTDSAISVAPQRSEDLKNFWTNYYSHRYDVDKFKECFDYTKSGAGEGGGASVVGNATQSDEQSNYFSMPIISCENDEFDKSVGGKKAAGKTSPIGVFLQSTIWSENSNVNYPDTDESFFIKVLNSTTTNQKPQDQLKMEISGTDKSYNYYPYQASKWSEGINGGPHGSTTGPQHHLFQQQQPLIVTSSSSSSSISTMDHSARSCYNNEFADSTPSSTSSYLGGNPNWHLPAGNNFQADIKSWSSSNPTSLTELYGGGNGGGGSLMTAAASSLGKKNSCNFDRNAATAGISSSSSPTSSNITLANHSTTNSGFLAYARIKAYAKLIDAKPIAKWQKPDADYQHHLTTSTPPDDENLLTSERTHFHPIKMSYADGHTFEISSNLDTVDFERSDSGYLYLESEKYLEYTRSDILAEEDSSVAGHYQQSLSVVGRDCTSSVASTKSSQSEFLIRFRVKNTDQACQTDSNIIGSSAFRTPLCYPVAASSSHLPLQIPHSSAHENEDDDDDEWMDIGCIGGIGSNIKDDEECISMDQWTMVEITKKCMDNNNASHTLWGMCPACNSEIKSIPANRLLKAELNVEGDEIMSDLRYMQDLYIGSDWEDQNGTRDDIDDDDTDLDAETIRDCEFYQAMATPAGCGDMEDEDQQQKDILYNVNKLIADLLRPENAHSLANALGAVGVGCVGGGGGYYGVTGDGGAYAAGADGVAVEGGINANDEKYIGGLWNSDENIIWKKEFNPIDIFTRFNNNNNDSFLDKLNWEYSNLAEIWGKASPEKAAPSTAADKNDKEELDDESNGNLRVTTTTTTTEADNYNEDEEENIKIACKNMKNLLKSSANIITTTTTTTTTPPNSALFEVNERRLNDSKRVQCFLSSNKFKISNRFDRKRRHSASQNVCSSSLNNNNNNNNASYNNNNNNNNSIVYENNNSKFSLASPDLSSSTFLRTSTPAAADSTTKINTNANANTITNSNTTKATTKDTLSEYDRNILTRDDNDDNDHHNYSDDDDDNDQTDYPKSQPQATIITCKYWTTMQPIVNTNNNTTTTTGGVNIVDGQATAEDLLTSSSIDAQAAAESFFIDKNSQFIDGLPSITLNTSSILKHVTLVSRPLTR